MLAMHYKLTIVIVIIIIIVETAYSEYIIKNTTYGQIKGKIKTSRADYTVRYVHFAGVPYCTPPVGKLRFKDPIPLQNWTDVWDATIPRDVCVQYKNDIVLDEVIGSEDCLYLDISTPIQKCAEKCPVCVWLHGGGFGHGTIYETGPDYFMEESIVLVQVQFRLSVFGFLSTEDDSARGNMGLKDQVCALKWIAQNIMNFGGDPDKVTVFGGSSGASCAQLHMLSPMSAGLFHATISQSGASILSRALQRNPLNLTRKLATLLEINEDGNEILIDKLQSISSQDLIKAAYSKSIVGSYWNKFGTPFVPSIEHQNSNAFLSDNAFQLLNEGKISCVPSMIGHNTEDGYLFYRCTAKGSNIENRAINISIFDTHPSLIVPDAMNIPISSGCYNETLSKIQQYYFNNGSFTHLPSWINYFGFNYVVRGIVKSAELVCQNCQSSLYFYIFSYPGSRRMSYLGGTGHYNEVMYLLYPLRPAWNPNETILDRITRKRMVKMWTNFATYKNPTPQEDLSLQNVQWENFCINKSFLTIDLNLTLGQDPNSEHMRFWDNLFKYCGFPPFQVY